MRSVRESLIDGSYALYSVAMGVTRNGVTILNTTSIRAESQEQAREEAMRMVKAAYPYPGSVYAVAVAPIALEMFAE